MKIVFHRTFEKQFVKLTPTIQQSFYGRLSLFTQDTHHSLLNNHLLHGKYAGCRSINISGDLRAVYSCEDHGSFLFIAIGTHSQLYE